MVRMYLYIRLIQKNKLLVMICKEILMAKSLLILYSHKNILFWYTVMDVWNGLINIIQI
jgi:hypothetical protein